MYTPHFSSHQDTPSPPVLSLLLLFLLPLFIWVPALTLVPHSAHSSPFRLLNCPSFLPPPPHCKTLQCIAGDQHEFLPVQPARRLWLCAGHRDHVFAQSVCPVHQSISGPVYQLASGPVYQYTSGSVDQYTSGPVYQWTSGPVYQWTSIPVDQWTSGPEDQYTSIPVDQYTSGPVVQYTSGPVVQYTSIPVYQWTSGPVDQVTTVRPPCPARQWLGRDLCRPNCAKVGPYPPQLFTTGRHCHPASSSRTTLKLTSNYN